MLYQKIPSTDLTVSRLCLGTTNYGGAQDERFCMDQMDRFTDEGGSFIDTANLYGTGPKGRSLSEKIIGRWFSERKNRHSVVLSGKGAHNCPENPAVKRVKPEWIEQDLSESLDHLRTDYIDLYFLHRDDERMPVEPLIDFLNEKIRQGKIRYIGCSNWSRARLEQANKYARASGQAGFISNQLMWSLARVNSDRLEDKTVVAMDAEYLAYHRRTGLHAMAYSALAKGFFMRLAAGGVLTDKMNTRYVNEENARLFAQICDFSARTGIPVTTVCLRYFEYAGFEATPVVSLSSHLQLRAALDAYGADCGALADFFAEIGA